MHNWLLAVHPKIALAIAAVALLLAVVTLIFAIVIRLGTERKLSILLHRISAQPGANGFVEISQDLARIRQAIEELVPFSHETRTQADGTDQALGEVVRVLADSRAEQLVRDEQEGGSERLALRQLYEAARSELAPFTASLSTVTPSVESLKACPTHASANLLTLLREIVQGYRQIDAIDSELASKIDGVSVGASSIAASIADARGRFESNSLTKEAYLQKIMSIQPPERHALPDPMSEFSRYQDLAARSTDSFLEWLDRINGLRELAIETEAREVESACTRIVRQSRAVLELFHVELENIEIGRTLYDSRLHELLHAVPRPGVRPETIIGIQKLGYRRDGKTVRKPMVVVAASGN